MALSPTYGTEVALTVTALTTTLLDTEWWASAVIDVENADDAVDHILGGSFVMGTTPTAGATMDVYAAARWGDGTNDFQASIGTGLPGEGEKTEGDGGNFVKEQLTLIAVVHIDGATTGAALKWSAGSMASVFGGTLPSAYCVLVQNNSGVALGSGSEVSYVPVTFADV